MAEIVFITHRIPYPPNKGDKIRSFNLLKHLAARHDVHLGTFIDDADDKIYLNRLREFCTSIEAIELKPRVAKLASLAALATGEALTVRYYRSRRLKAWLRRVLAERPVTAIIVSSSGVGQYGFGRSAERTRRIMDFVDVDSDKWLQYGRAARRPMRWLYAREGRELAREEKRIAAAFDAGIFVSSEEADFFTRQAPELKSKTYGMSNGVDIEFFDPELDYARPYPDSAPAIVFTGMMDYRANVDGVLWFAREVFPLIRAEFPQARFYVVGARPARAIRELAGQPGIHVTGKVADVRPYLAHARLAVAPLQVARGIQNKVLEALAMGKPVIGTPQAFEGIRPSPLLAERIAASPTEFAAAVRRILVHAEPPQCDQRLREFVRKRYNWESNLALLDALIEDRAIGDAAGADHNGRRAVGAAG